MSGNGDDWHSGERWPFANSPGGRQTVDYREGHIHQNQIRPFRQRSLDCRFAIIGFDDATPIKFQQGLEHRPCVSVIFNDQD
jgi:hypothetical protein